MSCKTWTIVKFVEENSVEAVPTSWLVGDTCAWPPFTEEKVINSIRNHEQMNSCWPRHKISIFRNGTYDTYLDARNKTKIAEYSSDLNDGDSKGRKYRKKKQYILSSEDEEECSKLPPPPPKPRNIDTEDNSDDMISFPPSAPLNEAQQKSPVVFDDKENNCICCPIHGNKKTDEAMKKITKQYYFVTNILSDINSKLENLKSHTSEQSSPEEESLFSKFTVFPLTNVEDMNSIEEYLGDKSNFKAACNEMSRMGGSNVYEFIKRCMSQMISNALASKYSYYGRKNKLKFNDLQLADLLLCAAGKAHANYTKKEVEKSMMKWLRRASERK